MWDALVTFGGLIACAGVVLGWKLRQELKFAEQQRMVERLRAVMAQRDKDKVRRITARTEHDREVA